MLGTENPLVQVQEPEPFVVTYPEKEPEVGKWD